MDNHILTEDVQQFAEQFELCELLRGKSFLITGATGLIGSVMTKCLLALNHKRHLDIKIVAVVRNIEKAWQIFGDESCELKFELIELGQITPNKIKDKVDYIVHLASPTASRYFIEHPVETLRTAIEGTTSILDYAKSTLVKGMVYASSLEVYGSNNTNDRLSEDFQGYVNPVEVRSSYNMGKRVCECLCHSYAKEYDVNVMMARLTQTFGAGISETENRVFAQFAKSAIKNENIVLHTSGESAKPYCYTTDAVSAILYLLLKGKKGEAYNIANRDSYISIRDMAQMIRDEFNPNIKVVFALKDNQGYAPETKLRLDSDKLEKLGWKPRYALVEMFSRLINYMKS
jgi:nucleoside-diphosphate-sugar epimerase